MRIARSAFTILLCFSSLLACEAAMQSGAATPSVGLTQPTRTRGPETRGVSVPPGTVGPFLASIPGGWLATWAEPNPNGDASWMACTFAQDGELRGAPALLAPAGSGVDLARFRALPNGAALLAASHASSGRYGLQAWAVSASGSLAWGPRSLTDSLHRIVWIDIAPLGAGAVIAWAEERESRAHLYSILLDHTGQPVGVQTRLHSDARAWQLIGTAHGAVIGVATVDGNVETIHLDAQGSPSVAHVISDQHSAEPDIDLAMVGDKVIVAFSDRRVLDPHLFSAVLSSDGHLRSNVRLLRPPNGPQALVALPWGPQGAYVLWQDFAQEPNQYRVAKLDIDGRALGQSVRLPPVDVAEGGWRLDRNAVPELAISNDGVMVFAPACAGEDCGGSPVLMQLSPDLSHHRGHLWFDTDSTPDLTWDFQCGAVGCAALTAYYATRTRVAVKSTTSVGLAIAAPNDVNTSSGDTPVALQAVVATPELAAVATKSFADGTLVAWLSAFDPNIPYEIPDVPAPDGRRAPVRAQLTTQWLAPTMGPRESSVDESEQRSVSIRARSVAGLSLTNTNSRALLTWTAIDNAQPQVFNTLLDPRGRKQRQEMLTRQTGEVLDVTSIAWKAGWLVGWIREHEGQSRAYAARLGETLGRMSGDVLLSFGHGLQSTIELGATSRGLWAVVAEVTADAGETLTWLELEPNTLLPHRSKASGDSPLGPETGWQRSHPRLRRWGDGLAVAWLEHRQSQYRLVFAELDGAAQPVAMREIALTAPGVSLDLECPERCYLGITTESASAISAGAGTLWTAAVSRANTSTSSAAPVLRPVARINAPAALRVAPSVLPSGFLHFDSRAVASSEPAPTASAQPPSTDSKVGHTVPPDSALYETWVPW